MDFQSAMETFAEAWVAANAGTQTQALALTRSKSPKDEVVLSSSPASGRDSDRSTGDLERLERSPRSVAGRLISAATPPLQHHHHHQDIVVSTSAAMLPLSVAGGVAAITPTNTNAVAAATAVTTQAATSNAPLSNSLSSHGSGIVATKIGSALSSATSENGAPPPRNGSDKILSSPSLLDRKDFDFSKVNPKSLPLHCVVESISSLQTSSSGIAGGAIGGGGGGGGGGSSSGGSGGSSNDIRSPWKRRPNIETDSYVIVPAATPFCDIVSTALQRLGYSSDIANTARGSIKIKNWQPLALEKISDSPIASVGEILGELTSVVTLRIVLLRAKPSSMTEIKDKLLKLLILQSHALLRSSGCPLDEITLSQLCRNSMQNTFPFSGDVSDEMRRNFDHWWTSQLSPQSNPLAPKLLPFIKPPPPDLDYATAAAAHAHLHNSNRDLMADNHSHQHQHQHQHSHPHQHSHHHLHGVGGVGGVGGGVGGVQVNVPPSVVGGVGIGGGVGGGPLHHHHHPHHNMIVHPAMQTVHSQYPSQKTRMRTSFDPEMELPKLQRWFHENPHPSRQQIQSYVIQLNALESRRGRKPLDVNNVVYWFKNARAAQKRAETRSQGGGMGNGYGNGGTVGMVLPNADYLKSPLSNPSEDIDNLSQHSDDMDDDMDRPSSPQVPLSLTTHERNRISPDTVDCIKIENDGASPHCSPLKNNVNLTIGLNNNEGSSERIVDMADQTLANHGGNNNHLGTPSNSPKTSPHSEDLDMEEPDVSQLEDFHSPSPGRDLPFPMVPNSMFSHSIMYMSHYIPTAMGQSGGHHTQPPNTSPTGGGLNTGPLSLANLSNDERRKRNRTFIDPVTEVPKLEQWFSMNTHPSHNLILKYTEDLNRMPYRQKFPRLESKNVQFWFKNRRAKCKRLKMSLYDTTLGGINSFGHADRE